MRQLSRLNFDWFLAIIPVILITLGIVIIYSITYTTGPKLTILQSIYAFVGLGLVVVFSLTDYRIFKGLSGILYVFGILLLILVLFLGTKTFGARRWIDFGVFQLQPSEIFKLILIIVLAKFFSDKEEIRIKDYLYILILIGIPIFLVLSQPDFGTATIFLIITGGILIGSNIKKIYLWISAGAALLAIPLVWHFLKDYQKLRIYTFLNPARDPFGAGYNVLQSTIAVGSGGIFGRGLGHGPQSQLNFLPVAHTDFIFAGVAESIGFVGASLLILIIIILVIRIIRVASLSKDSFGRFMAIGIAIMIIFQVFINIGMNLGIMPVTGIPLPFLSFGGSSLLTNLIAIGILQSIYIRHKKISFE
jgi:rod shape determining protein RodA